MKTSMTTAMGKHLIYIIMLKLFKHRGGGGKIIPFTSLFI